jgi:hypothetical protein
VTTAQRQGPLRHVRAPGHGCGGMPRRHASHEYAFTITQPWQLCS